MAAKTPTPKARALGVALRKARESRDVGVRELARQIGDDAGALSRYEKGERALKPEKASQILGALGINGSEYQAIMALTHDTEGPLWVAVSLPEQQHQADALLEFEDKASRIILVGASLIPGLLQTRNYTEAIMKSNDDVPSSEIRTRVAVRLGRQTVLGRAKPVVLDALMGEGVLDQLIGTSAGMIEQLNWLLEIGERENVSIRVMPKMGGWHPGLEGMFDLIESELMPVVQLDTRRSSLFLHEEQDVDSYRRAVEQASRVAMSPADSAGLIAEHIKRWESK
ncbi:MAG TPA: helix-turn-helix transcriptional regulator [Pseudonocardiaceae bacterium]|jgi:transcriptional regulator with XRE-family HTH domain|nr:helix-turn-helix transcriptional regulator [Pseudonocardiaceae bacterium]